MPTYEYRCDKCSFEFERDQRITEKPIRTCPKCKAQKVRRLISATSFVLKGGGWYKDLYSSSSGKKAEGSESGASGAEAKAESTSDSKSDSKSESKSESKKPGKKAASA